MEYFVCSFIFFLNQLLYEVKKKKNNAYLDFFLHHIPITTALGFVGSDIIAIN